MCFSACPRVVPSPQHRQCTSLYTYRIYFSQRWSAGSSYDGLGDVCLPSLPPPPPEYKHEAHIHRSAGSATWVRPVWTWLHSPRRALPEWRDHLRLACNVSRECRSTSCVYLARQLGVYGVRTWEWDPQFPCRSIIPPAISTGIPYTTILRLIWWKREPSPLRRTDKHHTQHRTAEDARPRAMFMVERFSFFLASLVLGRS